MSEAPPRPRLSRAAVASLVLGLATPLGWAATGLAALAVGLYGVRAVNRSDGRLRGRGLAVAGMALGGLAVGGTVLGLFVVVLEDARLRSQKVECINHLRLIGAAAQHYHDANDAFPPGTLPNADLPPDRRLSWLVALPDFVGEKNAPADRLRALAEGIDRSRAWDETPNLAAAATDVPVFRCPAHPDDPRAAPGRTHYVGLAGVGRDAAEIRGIDRGPFGAAVGLAGVGADPFALRAADARAGAFGYDRAMKLNDFTPGSSRTLFAAETAWNNGPWTAGGPPTVRGVDPADAPLIGPGRPFGGMHAGGLNVLFADGSAEFLRDTTPPAFFAELTRVRRGADEAPAVPGAGRDVASRWTRLRRGEDEAPAPGG
jgi:prepilin-type processing-associated H-X9-DG protein